MHQGVFPKCDHRVGSKDGAFASVKTFVLAVQLLLKPSLKTLMGITTVHVCSSIFATALSQTHCYDSSVSVNLP